MTMLKSVFIVSFIQQQSPIHNTACVSALQMNSDLPCLCIIIQFRGFMVLLMALQHQGFQRSYSSVMPQPLRHVNAGVLQSSNMKKVRLTNTWRIELRPHYDGNEKKKNLSCRNPQQEKLYCLTRLLLALLMLVYIQIC